MTLHGIKYIVQKKKIGANDCCIFTVYSLLSSVQSLKIL